MLELSDENVTSLLRECSLFVTPENKNSAEVQKNKVSGMGKAVSVIPERIEQHRSQILYFMEQLPLELRNGFRFTIMTVDKFGRPWCRDYQTLDYLIILGIAAGYMKFSMPREFWHILPQGLPMVEIINLPNNR